jgi:adenosylcobinamide kinase/adenosylcobinamide-phosphate guanylyltransferase
MPLQKLTLVLGGAASGKSTFAEALVTGHTAHPVYIATAQAWDAEMADKIARHRAARGPAWHTVEAPLDLAPALAAVTAPQAVLIDCATLWLTNVILAETDLAAAEQAFLAAVMLCPAPVVVVSNEVGQGIVPDNALARRFRNAQGALNQRLAARADLVVAVMAGLPLVLKGSLP